MDNKAQGALEYLLLIGGAVLVAAIVIALLASQADTSKTATQDASQSHSDALDAIETETYGP